MSSAILDERVAGDAPTMLSSYSQTRTRRPRNLHSKVADRSFDLLFFGRPILGRGSISVWLAGLECPPLKEHEC